MLNNSNKLRNHGTAPSSAPSPENLQICKWYSFTYNPIDQPPQKDDYMYEVFETMNEFRRFMAEFVSFESYLYPELSSQGRLHYHGIIRVYDPMRFYLNDLIRLRTFGCYEIDTIEDISIWLLYCKKQRDMWDMEDTIYEKYYIRYQFHNRSNAIKTHNKRIK
ncbi:MAG: putative replicase [Cressdnaviricota sp.]|nr:MAG: putative replicase [Cressdnaviricota sp.]